MKAAASDGATFEGHVQTFAFEPLLLFTRLQTCEFFVYERVYLVARLVHEFARGGTLFGGKLFHAAQERGKLAAFAQKFDFQIAYLRQFAAGADSVRGGGDDRVDLFLQRHNIPLNFFRYKKQTPRHRASARCTTYFHAYMRLLRITGSPSAPTFQGSRSRANPPDAPQSALSAHEAESLLPLFRPRSRSSLF